jgi:outer membrane protein OmpA-like peptidoglycan-associated protein
LNSSIPNIFKAAWLPGAKWMYAHLLDHDPAANFLSWQWVAGTFSSKKYIANQENINKYTNTKQEGSFLDTEYENCLNLREDGYFEVDYTKLNLEFNKNLKKMFIYFNQNFL